MWKCKVCEAYVEDDSWENCWRCSSSRNLQGTELEERQKAILQKMELAVSIKCLRCQRQMDYRGTKKFHEGVRYGFLLGDLGELLVNRERYDVYSCSHCGKLEFFLDGVGDQLRGET